MQASPITPTVRLLGLVSLFTDIASEMLYPIVPLFLATIVGAPMFAIGFIEGIAEFIAGTSKAYFGAWSDQVGKRKIFIVAGYSLSALVKPLPGLFPTWGAVFISKTVDRIGKGLRTAPRDALLASHSTVENRAQVFGFHRAMDTTGAALGPMLALIWLWAYPQQYSSLFLMTLIPSSLAIFATLWIRETPKITAPTTAPTAREIWDSQWMFWHAAPPEFKRLVKWLTLFALFNSSDVFLILKAQAVGFSATDAILGYCLYNLVYAATAYPIGKLADKWGTRITLIIGLGIYALVYAGFGMATQVWMCWGLFALYGIYAALTEGVSKAWLSNLIHEQRGTALGVQAAFASIAALVASTGAGLLWTFVNNALPFYVGAVMAIVTALGLSSVREKT